MQLTTMDMSSNDLIGSLPSAWVGLTQVNDAVRLNYTLRSCMHVLIRLLASYHIFVARGYWHYLADAATGAQLNPQYVDGHPTRVLEQLYQRKQLAL